MPVADQTGGLEALDGLCDRLLLGHRCVQHQAGIARLERHLARLAGSAEYFGFALDLAALRQELTALDAAKLPDPARLRLLVDRRGQWRLEAQPLAPAAAGPVRLGLAAAPVDEEDVFLYHKTSQRAVYEQARASRPDCDEVLLWNRRGELTETTIANLALALDGRLVTPPVASGLLAGVLRAELLETGQLHEQTLRLDDLARCQGITLISALRGRREAVWCGCVE